MTDLLSRLAGPESLGPGSQAVFFGVADHVYTIKEMTITNKDTVPIFVTVGINGSDDADLIAGSPFEIPAGGMAVFDGMLVLAGEDALFVELNGDAASALSTFQMSGLDQSP